MHKNEVNPIYLNEKVMLAIHAELEKKGCVQLRDFLTPEALYAALKSLPLKRKYVPDRFSFSEGKGVLPSFVSLLVPGKADAYLRVFGHRDYELLHDAQDTTAGWDVILDLQDMNEIWGGWFCYVKDEKEVLRVVPFANTLTIIHRENGMRSFVKYVNHHAQQPRKFIFAQVKFI